MTDSRREIRIRRLQSGDDRAAFRSGNIDLDRFFQRYAGQNQFRHHIGTTYVAIRANRVAGFVTISAGQIMAAHISKTVKKRFPAYPIPVLRIARLAVDETFQGHGIGRLLLRAMLELAIEMRDQLGCSGVVVDAKPETVTFYTALGFQELEVAAGALGDRPIPVSLFLPIQQIAAAVAPPK